MTKIKDLTGQRFGYLVCLVFLGTETIEKQGRRVNNHTWWKCDCDCGNQAKVDARHLKDGSSTSCGCHQKQITSDISKNVPNKKRALSARKYRRKANITEQIIMGNLDKETIAQIVKKESSQGKSFTKISASLGLPVEQVKKIALNQDKPLQRLKSISRIL